MTPSERLQKDPDFVMLFELVKEFFADVVDKTQLRFSAAHAARYTLEDFRQACSLISASRPTTSRVVQAPVVEGHQVGVVWVTPTEASKRLFNQCNSILALEKKILTYMRQVMN